MSTFFVCQYYKFFIFFSFYLHFTTTYKSPVSLDDYRVCMNSRTGEVRLGSDVTSAVIISLGKLKRPTSTREKTFTCKFEVHPTKSINGGLFAVIQQMVFRKNESTGDCIDFVQFETKNLQYSKKFCGRLSASLGMSPIFRSSDFASTTVTPTINSYVDPSARLTVHIFLDEDFPQALDELEMEIAFTTFKYCFPVDHNFKPCSVKFKERCIYKSFFNDGFINCPYPDCVDEMGCSESMKNEVVLAEKKSVGNRVIIGSVSVLLVIFLFFVCFVWMCRKYRKLCWAEEFAQSNSRTIELNEPPMRDVPISSGQNVASGLGLPPTEEDKDLPPSYASLFPNR